MAMKTLKNPMIQVAKLNAGRTVTGQDKGLMRRDNRFSAFLSYPLCLQGLAEHEPDNRAVTLRDDSGAIRAGRLNGPKPGWPRLSRLSVERRNVGKPATHRAA